MVIENIHTKKLSKLLFSYLDKMQMKKKYRSELCSMDTCFDLLDHCLSLLDNVLVGI